MRRITAGLLIFFYFSYGLTIEEAVNTAIKNNPSVKEGYIQQRISEEELKESRSKRFGRLEIFADYTHYNIPRLVYPISPPLSPSKISGIAGAKNITIPGIRYDLPLFTGFEIEKSVEISKLKGKLSEINLNITKNQLAFNVRSVYLKILTLKKQKKAMEKYRQALNQLYKNVSLSVKNGKKPEVDLLKVEYSLKNVESTIEALKNGINSLKEALRTLMNVPERDFELEDVTPSETVNLSRDTLMKKYFPRLYSYKKVKILQQISEKGLEKSKSEYFPHVYLSGIYQRNIGNSENRELWQVSLIVKYTLWDFGNRFHKKIKAKLELRKSEIEEEKIKLEVERKLTDAINQIKIADFKIKAVQKQLKYAKEVEKVEKLKYEEGVSDLYDYLYAQSQRYIAESKYYEAVYEKQRAIYYLYYVLERSF